MAGEAPVPLQEAKAPSRLHCATSQAREACCRNILRRQMFKPSQFLMFHKRERTHRLACLQRKSTFFCLGSWCSCFPTLLRFWKRFFSIKTEMPVEGSNEIFFRWTKSDFTVPDNKYIYNINQPAKKTHNWRTMRWFPSIKKHFSFC